MLSARRNKVSSRSVVGKTLNSTGLRIYMATIITTTDIMMSVTMRTSSMNPGSGVISAITMPRTAMGTPSSFQFVNASFHGARPAMTLACAANLLSLPILSGSRQPVGSLTLASFYAFRRPFINLKM